MLYYYYEFLLFNFFILYIVKGYFLFNSNHKKNKSDKYSRAYLGAQLFFFFYSLIKM